MAQSILTLPVLSDIELLKSASVGTIVTLGDSITEGVNSTNGQDDRWSGFLAYRLVNTPDTGAATTPP